ncbi:hypothetical protein FQN50_000223 [Emmonsiellopsis sp. PD_5]|nr:hypothetical protein FQN50_000223 [Emmonsiellopsis sp. PD_5]
MATTTTTTSNSSSSIITELEGDLFSDAPEGAVLIHACNCQGSWGSGIAEVFKRRYPAAYLIYHAHCNSHLSTPQTRTITTSSTSTPTQQPRTLKLPEGTALLIPPQPADYLRHPVTVPAQQPRGRGQGRGGATISTSTTTTVLRGAGKKHWIVCLFTSFNYGRQRSGAGVILENTRLAVGDLKGQIEGMKMEKGEEGEGIGMGELWGCRFNAGLFGVPWEETRGVLEEVGLGMRIVRPVGE